MTTAIRKMMETPGLYLAGDSDAPGAMVPIVSNGGKIYSMAVDEELDPEKFYEDRLTLRGPFLPQQVGVFIDHESEEPTRIQLNPNGTWNVLP